MSATGSGTSRSPRSRGCRTRFELPRANSFAAADSSPVESRSELTERARHLADLERSLHERESALAAADADALRREHELEAARKSLEASRGALAGERSRLAAERRRLEQESDRLAEWEREALRGGPVDAAADDVPRRAEQAGGAERSTWGSARGILVASSSVLLALSSTQKLGLALAGAAFVVFALVSSMVIPRWRPDFPGRHLGWFTAVAALFTVGMLATVFFVARETGEEEAAAQPTLTEPTEPTVTTETTETEPTATTQTEPTGTTRRRRRRQPKQRQQRARATRPRGSRSLRPPGARAVTRSPTPDRRAPSDRISTTRSRATTRSSSASRTASRRCPRSAAR